jgi:SAM-dependent methyltransferase
MGYLRFRLPPRNTFSPNGESDPLHFYYMPLVGRIFTARIEMGLRLLGPDARFRRLLEIGYGSGLLMPTLAPIADELYGVDLEEEPPALRGTLERLGVKPHQLVRADIQKLPFPDGNFDGVVAFSILEHLKQPELERAAAELARVLEPGGRLLVGCPAVHGFMNAAFAAIGFRNIEHHHFSGIPQVLTAFTRHFTIERRATLPRLLDRAPLGWAPYTTVLLRKSC